MEQTTNLLQSLQHGNLDEILTTLYGKDLDGAHARCEGVLTQFAEIFGHEAEGLFSAPGRTEIGGNHTDHQHGCVLAAAINLDLLAAVSTNQSGMIRVHSEGYPEMVVDLANLTPVKTEENTSMSLIRGVASKFASFGCEIAQNGLDIYMVSNVPGGSGLSSSAAFEVLMGTIINNLFWDSRCTAVEIAQIGQYAENVFFGKPCGLMDQTASSVGAMVAIDFENPASPVVKQVPLDFAATGHALCILDSGADHADLTSEYASITTELKDVCHNFGKEHLRDVAEGDFMASLHQVRAVAGDRATLRAFHFFADNRLAQKQAQAILDGDFDGFLKMVNDSGNSSALCLQNVVPTGATRNQELLLTIMLSKSILGGRGAVRVHGGGFGGTAQAFVPLDLLDEFKGKTEAVLGEGSCHILSIRPLGGVRLA